MPTITYEYFLSKKLWFLSKKFYIETFLDVSVKSVLYDKAKSKKKMNKNSELQNYNKS